MKIQTLNEPMPRKLNVGEKFVKRCEEATEVQEQFIDDFIIHKKEASNDDWNRLLQDIFTLKYGSLNVNTVHGKIMEKCSQFRNLHLAKSYLRFMKENGRKFNQAVVIEFIDVCFRCQSSLTEDDRKTIEYFTNHLLSKYSLMENKLGGAVVNGLSLMNDWKKCLEIVNTMEKNIAVKSVTYTTLITCLLHNHQFELARSKLIECFQRKLEVGSPVYLKWIDVYHSDPAKLQELLCLFRDYNIIPKKMVCVRLIEAYSQLPPKRRLHGEFTEVHRSGHCQSCKQKLIYNMLSKDEFEELQEAFLNRVLVGSDIFLNTTPSELESFFKFVKLQAPFDVVIDGLNIIYRRGRTSPKSEQALILSETVNYFFRRNKKILVVGRSHIKKLPAKMMENVYEKSAVFLINDLSEDDPFVIYAALYSGKNCVFVTKDFMRSEKFRLSTDRLTDLFRRWQLSHQLVPKMKGEMGFELPLRFKIGVQNVSPQSWHIPYHEDSRLRTSYYDDTNITNWLCLRR